MTHTPPHEPPELAGRRILLGLTGSVACYKAAELCRLLTQAGARVQVAMSEGAQHFITAATMQALAGQPVFTSQWDERPANGMAHIQLGREADAILVAPASTDFLARLAAGRADDLLSLLCLARPRERAPLLLAPAMNREMWSHPATQRNVRQAAADGARVLAVGAGTGADLLALLQAPELLEEVIAALTPQTLAGRRVVVTAGPTFEAIDPVRGLTNRSSGKMGFAMARAARLAGAQVTLIAGPVHLPTPHGVARVDVESALQMQAALQPALQGADVLIAAAAVADWRAAEVAAQKMKKDGSGLPPPLRFVENPDLLAAAARSPRAQAGQLYCVGFAAESENLLAHAQAKRQRKGVPLLAGNIGPATFGRDDNALLLIDEAGVTELPAGLQPASKRQLARLLVDEIARRLPRR